MKYHSLDPVHLNKAIMDLSHHSQSISKIQQNKLKEKIQLKMPNSPLEVWVQLYQNLVLQLQWCQQEEVSITAVSAEDEKMFFFNKIVFYVFKIIFLSENLILSKYDLIVLILFIKKYIFKEH